MKIAITGGTGFVGKAVTKSLLLKGGDIRILSRSAGKNDNALRIKVDYENEESIRQAIDGCDAVIHLAATLFARTSDSYFKANANTATKLARAANKAKIKKIVYISSLAAGGPSCVDGPDRTEDMPDNPVSNYGKSKLAAEKELKEFNGHLTILRPPIVYGPKDAGFSKIAEWVKKGLMVVPGSIDTKFSFIYLSDLAKCIEQALYCDLPDKEKYYVCDSHTYKWGDFIEKMAQAMKVPRPKMISLPSSLLYAAGFVYEMVSLISSADPVLNRDKAREASAGKWTCLPHKWEKTCGEYKWTNLEDGLKMTFKEEK